jgi:hypothetical protein
VEIKIMKAIENVTVVPQYATAHGRKYKYIYSLIPSRMSQQTKLIAISEGCFFPSLDLRVLA